MPISFRCPNCKATLTVDDDAVGLKASCVTCGQKLLVPSPPAPPVKPAAANKTVLGELASFTAPASPALPLLLDVELVATPEEPRKKVKRKRHDDDEEDDDFDDGRDVRVRCPFCRKKGEPYIRDQVSGTGWIVFFVVLVVFFPLCWVGLFIKERARFCRRCHSRIDRGGLGGGLGEFRL